MYPRGTILITDITAVGGLLGLAVSVALLVWQTRAVAEQSRVSNAIAGTSVLHDALESVRPIYMLFFDHPELRQYFYDGALCPRRGKQRVRIITVAEMLADALEDGLVGTRLVPSSESFDDWSDYCQYLLQHSPALSEIVTWRPQWWPNLHRLVRQLGA